MQALRVDGGACQNDFLMQFQADVLGFEVERPALLEVTALGAALLAGIRVGFFGDRGEIEAVGEIETFSPRISEDRRETLYAGWQRAVERSRHWIED
jgi:glycerol kinase